MMREEEILFANTKQLIQRNEEAGNILYTTFGLIKDSVRLMQEDHKSAQESLIIFRELTNDYNLPENACGSYQHLFAKLKEFERNYLLHIRIENEILFPKALAVDGEIDEVKTNFGMMI
jgi:regulator of cell morphogenesis and NO signaling